jgi:hypothetical protein
MFGGMAGGMRQGSLNLHATKSGRVGTGRSTTPQIPGVPVGQRRGTHRNRRGGGESWCIEWVGCTVNALCVNAHSQVMSWVCTATAAHKVVGHERHAARLVP